MELLDQAFFEPAFDKLVRLDDNECCTAVDFRLLLYKFT